MLTIWLRRAVVALAECLRLTHGAHAALTIGHDWSIILHGSVPTSSIFAAYVIFEIVQHLAKRARRAYQARLLRQAIDVDSPAAPTSAEGRISDTQID